MSKIMSVIADFKQGCDCGKKHETAICDIEISSGAVHRVGEILKKNGFSRNLLLVADENTLKAAEGITESLEGFSVTYKLYKNLRLATMEEVEAVEALIAGKDISVLSVGTGSLNDTCRLAAARQDKKLCIFATAPSMDGFASYGSPIVCNGFKATYAAKSPEVVIGDTKILAAAPNELKSAGFGDMVAKYVGLVDWQISTLLTGEYYCEKIASLTRDAVDELMDMADKVTANDEYTAGKIFEALLKTGIGMSFAQNSRPASGSEHIISHLIECVELRDGILPNFHGDDIGVCTLAMLKFYQELSEAETIDTQNETVDWDEVYAFYGEMAEEVRKLNEPENIVDDVDKDDLKNKWPQIVNIIKSVPSYETCKDAMKRAGCKITVEDIGKNEKLFENCIKFSPYMRKRLTLLRLRDMIKIG
ncbi:MAG: sn-glycerol-1-phosphate dehydrogenase [Ruminococcaceae bacterium]|nr:sn-glycerol-1-phosphate dehydrogenase [Oscillospiraceae bacterium]